MYAQHLVDIPRLMNPQTNTTQAVTDTPTKSQQRSNSFTNILRRTSEKLVLLEQQQQHNQQQQFHRPFPASSQGHPSSPTHSNQSMPTHVREAERIRHERSQYVDNETRQHIDRANLSLSQYMHLLANEPSIGLSHVCDHISRSIPKLLEIKKDLRNRTKEVEKFNYDLDSTLKTIKDLKEITTFTKIKQGLTIAIQRAQLARGHTTIGLSEYKATPEKVTLIAENYSYQNYAPTSVGKPVVISSALINAPFQKIDAVLSRDEQPISTTPQVQTQGPLTSSNEFETVGMASSDPDDALGASSSRENLTGSNSNLFPSANEGLVVTRTMTPKKKKAIVKPADASKKSQDFAFKSFDT